jgi:hypothetical protein
MTLIVHAGDACEDIMNAQNGLQIDDLHCRAICDEIGDRLRTAVGPGSGVLPVRLQILMAQLAAQDRALAPSIVPTLDDMTLQPDAACDRQSFAA